MQTTFAGLTPSEEGRAMAPPCDGEMEENPWGYRKRLRFIAGAIAKTFPLWEPTSVRVLDLGCGNGSLVALPLARRGFDVTGLDFHLPSIEHARRLSDAMPNARFIAGTVDGLPSALFDVIILSEVLEHVFDPEALLLASLKHLQPDGIVLITVPNGYGEFEIDSFIFRIFRLQSAIDLLKRLFRIGASSACSPRLQSAATDNDKCGHVQFFRRGRLRRLFEQCSLIIVDESAGSLVCGPMVCHSLARSRRFIEWNARIADKLPMVFASSWYFVLRRATS